jgi:hypothetical protein
MDKSEIQSVLRDALENEIPSSQVDLWQAVQANVRPREFQRHGKGDEKMVRVPRFALLVTLMLAVFALTLATPQGRAFAQSALTLFRRVDETMLPLAPSQAVVGGSDGAAPTATPPAPLVSVAEAEAQVGFDVAELPEVPNGLTFLGARVYGGIVHLEYETEGHEGHLMIQQSQAGFLQSDWDSVPADAISQVRIEDVDAEFVAGTFVIYAAETTAQWNPDAPILRLRWHKDGVWFAITKSGEAKAIEYLDQEALVEIAEKLVASLP